MLDLSPDDSHGPRAVGIVDIRAPQNLRARRDGRERIAQLMTQCREELILGPIGFLGGYAASHLLGIAGGGFGLAAVVRAHEHRGREQQVRCDQTYRRVREHVASPIRPYGAV